jgi:hypothetical protein
MYIPGWMQVVALIVLSVLVLGLLYIIFKNLLVNLFSKRVTTTAKLISKIKVPYSTQKVYMSSDVGVESGLVEKSNLYKFYFELSNKDKVIELEVSKDVFDVTDEGAEGMLDYKGHTFFSFDGKIKGTGTVIDSETNQNDFIGLNQ